MRLRNKVALITGGATGVGKAVCQGFAVEGAKVVINYPSDTVKAEDLVTQIRRSHGEAICIRSDISQEEQVKKMVKSVEKQWGGIDILVNNAGIYPRKPWYEITSEEWDRVLAVNLKGCFLNSKAVFPYMKCKGSGKIINVSSVTFWSGQQGFLHYVSSKGGVIGFTRALAREVGKYGINVNAVTPGAVKTEQEMIDFSHEDDQRELAEQMAEVQCFSRRQLPEDLVGTFVYLASEDSDFVTGQTINVDGGWMMH